MCWQCHQHLSDEAVRKMFRESLEMENPQYEKWNQTSVSHAMITLSGFNGYEASELAYQVINGYITWMLQNTEEQVVKDVYEKFRKMVEIVKTKLDAMREDGATEEEIKRRTAEAIETGMVHSKDLTDDQILDKADELIREHERLTE